jgi:hypothetical protein
MSSTKDPLFDRIRALPRPALDPGLDAEVHRATMAVLMVARPRARTRERLLAVALAAGATGYFFWAVAFVLHAG